MASSSVAHRDLRIGSGIGTDNQADQNIKVFNARADVFVRLGRNNSDLGISVFGNGELGIDLGLGGNQYPPAPVIPSASVGSDGVVKVAGTFFTRGVRSTI
jgi:hypothetical protein